MKIGIFGSSGFAREVADICSELSYKEIFFIDDVSGTEEITGYKIIAENDLEKLDCTNINFVIGIGNGKIRKKIARKFSNLNFINVIHPSALISYSQRKVLDSCKGMIICRGSNLSVNIQIGDFTVFCANSIIGHDCCIMDFVTVLPGAILSGNVKLCKFVTIGAGAVILPGESLSNKKVIDEGSMVGAGAVVTKAITKNKIVKGVPAK